MPWSWRLEKSDGRLVAAPARLREEAFATQSDAETWLGEHWQELAEHGVDQVSLFDGEDFVYGPMSLHPAS